MIQQMMPSTQSWGEKDKNLLMAHTIAQLPSSSTITTIIFKNHTKTPTKLGPLSSKAFERLSTDLIAYQNK